MRYFVISRRFDGEDSFSIMADQPRIDTREKRLSTAAIQLSAKADKLTLDELVELYRSGELQKSKVWTVIQPPRPVEAGAKAFAKYRETRATFPPIHPAPTAAARKKERRRIIRAAKLRHDAIVAVGAFCLEFGHHVETSKKGIRDEGLQIGR